MKWIKKSDKKKGYCRKSKNSMLGNKTRRSPRTSKSARKSARKSVRKSVRKSAARKSVRKSAARKSVRKSRAPSAYNQFVKKNWNDADLEGLNAKQKMRGIASMWQNEKEMGNM
jgi:hypothetical protein